MLVYVFINSYTRAREEAAQTSQVIAQPLLLLILRNILDLYWHVNTEITMKNFKKNDEKAIIFYHSNYI